MMEIIVGNLNHLSTFTSQTVNDGAQLPKCSARITSSTWYHKATKTAVKVITVITTNKLLQFCVLVYYILGNNVFVADSDAEEGDEDLSAELAALKMDASKPVKR